MAALNLEAMLADDLDAQLAALEDDAPLTQEPIEGEVIEPKVTPDAEGEPAEKAEEWTPPNREAYENVQKALRSEREARRAEQQRARLYEQNVQRMQERFEQFQAQQMAARLQQAPPDPYAEPEAARAWAQQQQAFQQQLWQAEQQRAEQRRVMEQQERQFQHVTQTVEEYESEFKAQHPDYDDATEHMLQVQQSLLEGAGYPPDVAAQQVAMWSVSVAQQAIQAGRDPAQWAYEHAKKMGYQPKGTGAEAAAQKLAAIKAGQASAQTLSGGGAGAKGGTSLKQIAGLEGAAFDSAMDKWLSDAIRGR